MRSPSYVLLEVIRSGNVDAREQITLADLRLIRQAIGIACADSTDEGKRLSPKYQRILNKLNELFLASQ